MYFKGMLNFDCMLERGGVSSKPIIYVLSWRIYGNYCIIIGIYCKNISYKAPIVRNSRHSNIFEIKVLKHNFSSSPNAFFVTRNLFLVEYRPDMSLVILSIEDLGNSNDYAFDLDGEIEIEWVSTLLIILLYSKCCRSKRYSSTFIIFRCIDILTKYTFFS